MSRIACVGTGNVGRSWGVVFARAGHEVVLWDMAPAGAEAAAAFVREQVSGAQVRVAASPEAAADGVAYVQESIAERPEPKQALFAALDAAAPADAILASSTSAIPASLIFRDVPGRHRCLVSHPINPPHLIPLVEVAGADFTAPETVKRTVALMESVGQAPVVLKREIEGFLLNRLQWALLGEALHLVGEGYCEAADIDRVLTHGLARRWALIGPFTVGHLNADRGLEGYFDVLADALKRVRDSVRADYEPDQALISKVHGQLADRIPVEAIRTAQRTRDDRVAALRTFLDQNAMPERIPAA